MLALKLLLLLLRLRLASSGSEGLNPLALAKRLSTSVRLTTPDSRPLVFCPGIAAAGTALVGAMDV